MGLLDSVFTVNVSSQSASPSRPGFGTALLLSYHTHWTNRVRVYSSTAAMVSDGFAITDPEYAWATTYFSQNPAPQKLKIGRALTAHTQQNVITIHATPPTGAIISFTLGGVTFSHTVASETAAQVATAIAAAVTAALPTNVITAAASTASVLFTSAAGKLVNLVNLSPLYQDASEGTSNTGAEVTADLVACAAEDNDWYALALASCTNTEAQAAATYAEANKKLFVPRSAEYSVVLSSSTTDIGYVAKNTSLGRTAVWFNRAGGNLSNVDAAILGSRLPADPGSDTWAFKTLAGVPADNLTDSEISALKGKRVSYYVSSNNVNFTQGGQVGGGEWADIVRGLDWVRSELQIAQFALFLNRPKVPFTNPGISMVKGTLLAVLKQAEKQGLFVDGSSVVSAPDAADVSTADKAARTLNGVTWSAELAEAIHTTTVNGTVAP